MTIGQPILLIVPKHNTPSSLCIKTRYQGLLDKVGGGGVRGEEVVEGAAEGFYPEEVAGVGVLDDADCGATFAGDAGVFDYGADKLGASHT